MSKHEDYEMIPGTTWGIYWSHVGEHHYPVIAKLRPSTKKNDTLGEAWSQPAFCVNIGQVASIIAADIGAGSLTTMLTRINEANARLEGVLGEILSTAQIRRVTAP